MPNSNFAFTIYDTATMGLNTGVATVGYRILGGGTTDQLYPQNLRNNVLWEFKKKS